MRAAGLLLERHPAEIAYITTTDYAMHTYSPDERESARHMALLDEALGALIDAHAGATLLVTADHGMSSKTRMVDAAGALRAHGIRATVVPIIKDLHVVHHSNLGGCAYVYVDDADAPAALDVLRGVPGIDAALPREQAASEMRLLPDRIGDIVVTGGAGRGVRRPGRGGSCRRGCAPTARPTSAECPYWLTAATSESSASPRTATWAGTSSTACCRDSRAGCTMASLGLHIPDVSLDELIPNVP